MPMPPAVPFGVLIFSATAGYRHKSIPAGIYAVEQLAAASLATETPFTTAATEDPAVFDPETLADFRVVVLLQCSGEFLTSAAQLDALQAFVRGGGGIVAIHCASAGLPSSPWYGRLLGAVFDNHPAPQRARVQICDPNHFIMADSLGRGSGMELQDDTTTRARTWTWDWMDEWYNFKTHPRSVVENLHVVMAVDEGTYEGGSHGGDHPIAWCQEFDGGRVFYTALGHFDEAYQDGGFMAQVLGGVLWTSRVVVP